MTDVELPSELVNRLHELRIRKGLTIQQMAERCGLPKSSLESYMKFSGAKRPGVDALIAIADGMDTSIDWLVGRSADSFSARLRQSDYAMACFATVSSLINWMRAKQNEAEKPVIGKEDIAGFDDAQVAAKSMLVFIERVQRFADTRPVAGADRDDLFKRLSALLSQETGN